MFSSVKEKICALFKQNEPKNEATLDEGELSICQEPTGFKGSEEPPRKIDASKGSGKHNYEENIKPGIGADRWIELGLAGAIMIATAINVIVAYYQWSAANGQLNVMREQARAWVRADISLDGPVVFTEWANDRFINVRLKFELKNFGSVPAVNTRIMTAIVPFGGADRQERLDRAQADMCKVARQSADGNKIGGTTAFPTEPKVVKSGSGSGGLYRTGNPGALAVLGCIDYTYADDKHGQTGFRKILGRVDNNLVVGIPFVRGQPRADQEPISPELLASGFPKEPARYAEISSDGLYFSDAGDGDYAK